MLTEIEGLQCVSRIIHASRIKSCLFDIIFLHLGYWQSSSCLLKGGNGGTWKTFNCYFDFCMCYLFATYSVIINQFATIVNSSFRFYKYVSWHMIYLSKIDSSKILFVTKFIQRSFPCKISFSSYFENTYKHDHLIMIYYILWCSIPLLEVHILWKLGRTWLYFVLMSSP